MNGVLENDVMDALDLLQGKLPKWDDQEEISPIYGCGDSSCTGACHYGCANTSDCFRITS